MSRRDQAAARSRVGATGADFWLEGVPEGTGETDFVLFRSRVYNAMADLVQSAGPDPFTLRIGYRAPQGSADGRDGSAASTGSAAFTESAASPGPTGPDPHGPRDQEPASSTPAFSAAVPKYRLSQLVLPGPTMERLLDCVAFYQVRPLVFETWNLRSIEPNPSMAVNFRGPPGTGKTLAAHAIADRLGLRILSARLSDLESKYHGDGPKNLAALFAVAAKEQAVLFIDEAESLLSRRFAQPEQAAESAINSMRTELLQALDAFEGLVVFASNLPHSYDAAIESRLFHVDFALPDADARALLWHAHLPSELPRAPDVSVPELAAIDGVSGRDIKLAVIMAAVGAARRGLPGVDREALLSALAAQRDKSSAPAPTPTPTTDPASPAGLVAGTPATALVAAGLIDTRSTGAASVEIGVTDAGLTQAALTQVGFPQTEFTQTGITQTEFTEAVLTDAEKSSVADLLRTAADHVAPEA